MNSRRVAVFATLTSIAAGCTVLHPLDRYQGGQSDGQTPDPDGGMGEAGQDAGGDVSVTTDGSAPRCDLAKPFGAPVPVTELNSSAEDTATDVSVDELTFYFSTNRGGGSLRLWYATRANRDAPWNGPQPLFPNAAYDDWSFAVTADGLTAVVASDRDGSTDLYVGTRPSALATFGAFGLAAGTNSPASDEGPRWAMDGKTLYFDSTRAGTRDLYRVPASSSSFGTPQAITELNTSSAEGVPVVTSDELTIYFYSDRPPTTDPGDIYVATRSSKTAAFGTATLLPNVNSAGLDAPNFISADGCTLYLSSTRVGGKFDIYVARRPQ